MAWRVRALQPLPWESKKKASRFLQETLALVRAVPWL
jgi:hypothetical protein